MSSDKTETSTIEFNHIYSHPGDMESVVNEFHSIFEKTAQFLLPIEVNTTEGLGWVLIELLNNAVRSPVSLAMNEGETELDKINFFTDIKIQKTVRKIAPEGKTVTEISIMNRGDYVENVLNSIQSILNSEFTILDCEERFMLKGSFTGNGGMGILLSKKQVENALGGTLSLSWHDGFYDFIIRF